MTSELGWGVIQVTGSSGWNVAAAPTPREIADLYEPATQGPPLNQPRAQADTYADLYRYVVTRADAAWVAGRVAGTLEGSRRETRTRRHAGCTDRLAGPRWDTDRMHRAAVPASSWGSASPPRERPPTQAVRVRRPRRLRAAFATPLATLRAAHAGASRGATSFGSDSTTTCFQAENTCCGRVPVT